MDGFVAAAAAVAVAAVAVTLLLADDFANRLLDEEGAVVADVADAVAGDEEEAIKVESDPCPDVTDAPTEDPEELPPVDVIVPVRFNGEGISRTVDSHSHASAGKAPCSKSRYVNGGVFR